MYKTDDDTSKATSVNFNKDVPTGGITVRPGPKIPETGYFRLL
jgi:hypothetical protein